MVAAVRSSVVPPARAGVLVFLGALALLMDAHGSHAADWPGWRGPSRDGSSAETGLLQEWAAAGPPLVWSASGVGSGFSSVAAVGDRLYTMGDRDGAQYVLALDRGNGRIVWKARVGGAHDDERGGHGERPPSTERGSTPSAARETSSVSTRRAARRSGGAAYRGTSGDR